MVIIPISVAYGFMNMNCGDAGLQNLKEKQQLHVIDESWRWEESSEFEQDGCLEA